MIYANIDQTPGPRPHRRGSCPIDFANAFPDRPPRRHAPDERGTNASAAPSTCYGERRPFIAGSKHPMRSQALGRRGILGSGIRAIYRLPVSSTLVKFLIVGGVGFLINELVLLVLFDTPLAPFLPARGATHTLGPLVAIHTRLLISSVLAVETAIVFQFNAHEHWTFGLRDRRGWTALRFLKFNATAAGGAIIAVCTVYFLTPVFDDRPYVPNAIGTLLGFTWNWSWNTLVIWPQRQRPTSLASRR